MANLGVYIQVPFCASKCTYCNFSSRVERRGVFDRYTAGLVRELSSARVGLTEWGLAGEVLSCPADSIYFGGGTPTLLGAERLAVIVGALREALAWSADVEFTVETTPGSADPNLLGALRGLGASRLSIGAQTLDDQELRAVGRLHSVADTSDLVQNARHAGFGNISIDLMAGLPHQTEASFQRSLEAAVGLRPEHVSLYLFEVDEKSRLGREVVHGGTRYHAAAVPGDDFMADAYEFGRTFLARAGYRQYEISNFALPGFESRHNRKYWELAPYLGLGAGAHSFDGARRWSNYVGVAEYLAKLEAGRMPVDEVRTLTPEEQLEEFFFLGLRQADGVDLNGVRKRWGEAALHAWEGKIARLVQEGSLIREGDRVRLARRAYLVSNEVFQEFVSAA
jgi:oxygen-independent coproporphyrinogen-3 oxidase